MYTKSDARPTASPKGGAGLAMNDASEGRRPPVPDATRDSLDLASLATRYRRGVLRPSRLVEEVLARIDARGDDHGWIHRLTRDELLSFAWRIEMRGPTG